MDIELISKFCKEKEPFFTTATLSKINERFKDLPDEYYREFKELKFLTFNEAKKMTRRGQKILIKNNNIINQTKNFFLSGQRLLFPFRTFKSQKNILKEVDKCNYDLLEKTIYNLSGKQL